MLEIYDRTTQQFIPITPATEPELHAILDCWREDSGDPRTLPEFLACFCDVVTGRIDETVTATSSDWASIYLQRDEMSVAL
jgi:hypothetical protein